ncbi:MAG: trigger factor [Bacillota bacterium]
MEATVERIEGNFAHLAIEVDEAQVKRALDESYRKLAQRVIVPGFRKGKVPRHVLEMRIGKGALYEDALKALVPRAYADAVKETGIDPIDQPDFDVEQIEDGRPLKFKARVLVRPEVKLCDYRAVRVEKNVPRVEDDEVDQYIRVLQQNRSAAVPADHDTVAEGDLVTVDMALTSEGKPLEVRGGGKDLVIEVGAKQDLQGLGQGLVGLAIGDEKDIETLLPENFHDKDYAGKAAVAHVKVKDIRQRKLPELDDEFARAVGGYESLDAMRRDIRERLQKAAEGRAETEYKKAVINEITKESEVDVPEVLVERQVDRMVRSLADSLAQQGLTLEGYLDACGLDQDALRKSYRDDAYSMVKSELVMDAVSKAEGITATRDEIDTELREVANRERKTVEEIRELLTKIGRIGDIEDAIVRRKTIDHLVRLSAGE